VRYWTTHSALLNSALGEGLWEEGNTQSPYSKGSRNTGLFNYLSMDETYFRGVSQGRLWALYWSPLLVPSIGPLCGSLSWYPSLGIPLWYTIYMVLTIMNWL
jgi:hypothetical protein